MKGIRKLFLGLILLTLFGVAFKVDAKAAISIVNATVVDDWSSNSTGDVTFKWDSASDVFNTTATKIGFKIANGAEKDVYLKDDSGTKKYSWDNTTYTAFSDQSVNSFTIPGIQVPKANVSPSSTTGIATLTVQGTEAAAALSTTVTIKAGKVTLTAVNAEGKNVADAVVTASPFYLLTKDTKDIEALEKKGGYIFNTSEGWTATEVVSDSRSFTYTMPDNTDKTLTAHYKKNNTALTITNLNGASVIAGEKTSTTAFPYTLETGTYTLPTDVTDMYIGDKKVIPHFEGGYFWFNAPEAEMKGATLKINMVDGVPYTYTIDVVDVSKTAIKFEQPAYTIGTSTPTLLKLISTGVTPDTVTYSVGSLTKVDSSKTGVTVSSATSVTGVTVTATATYTPIGGTTISPKTATTTVTVQSLKMKDDLFVTKGQKVSLGDFISTGTKDMVVTTLNNNADSYIELTGGAGSKLSDISVKGKAKTTALDKTKFVVDGNQMKVTVYEAPSMTVETSGLSGSSTGSGTYSYKVTMPWGLYRDDTKYWVPELKKAILIFKSSSDDGKTKEVVLDDLKDDSDKLSKTQTKKIDVKTLTSYLRDICKKDEETVTVWACAVNGEGNNDTEVKTDSKELKVYKISLDTNGNKTSYTVNGDTVYDYFYKIDGVEYTVVAKSSTGKGKVDKANSVNADSATETTGTATIKLGSSGSGVLGEKRIKVAFSSSSTPDDPTGGGSSDDYDDVPKTGESKADIWILWSVLFISILGAGFMIWKRFGLVRAIAEADEEVAIAEHEEQIKAAKKEKEDKIKMLKDLRNL